MSKKSTKIIAAAGVVAGLGVAALPAMTFATAEVKGKVNITADVQDAIAMTIKGNGDGATTPVDVYNPTGANQNINGHDTTSATPYAGTETEAQLQASSSTLSILPNSENLTEATSQIKVWTNAIAGYHLSITAGADGVDLVRTGATATAGSYASEDKIEANATISAGTNHWGYKVNSGSFAAITTGDVTIHTTSAPAAGDTTDVTYGVSTLGAQNQGTYTGTVIYTATTNNPSGS